MPLHFPSEKKLERGGLLFTYLHSIFSKTKKCHGTLGVKFGEKVQFWVGSVFFLGVSGGLKFGYRRRT